MHYLSFLVLVLLLGCSSLNMKAKELYEAKAYEDALAVYEEILQSSPQDTEATIGRIKCRNMVIDSKLLEIRRSRLGENEQNSLDMLLTLVQQENEWNTFPSGPVAYTQDEESREALQYITSKVNETLRQNFPLKGNIWLTKYKVIFQGFLLKKYDDLAAHVKDSGRDKCHRLLTGATNTRPYYSQFVQKFCSFFGEESRDIAHFSDDRYSELYGKVIVQAKITGAPGEIIPPFQDAIAEAFTHTPWFDAKGISELKVTLVGKFERTVRQNPEVRVHEYTVQIPYTAYVKKIRSRQVPYTTNQYQCAYNYQVGQVCGNVQVTSYQTQFYSEMEPETRYRDEPRSQTYAGTNYYQFLGMFLKGKVQLGKTSHDISLTEKSEDSGFEHNVDMPDIGLTPQTANLPDPLEWIKQQAGHVGDKVRTKVSAIWGDQYCEMPAGKASVAQQGDQVHRCLRLNSSTVPPFVDNWYKNNFGIDINQADQLLGVKDY
jgi:hypothetical protein